MSYKGQSHEPKGKPFHRKVTLLIILSFLALSGLGMTVRPTHATTVWRVDLDANSISSTDANPQTSLASGKTFRIGAIINASNTQPLTGVYGWEFGVVYDNSTVVPQGDPVASSATDGAGPTVSFGTMTGTGQVNWGGKIAVNQAFGSSVIADPKIDNHHAEIQVFFTIIAASPQVTISPIITGSVKGNLLANVAFELMKPAESLSFTIVNVRFVDSTAGVIPNIMPGSPVTVSITNTPPVASFSSAQLPYGDASCTPLTGSICSPYAFEFNATASFDTDGTVANPFGYFWDFGDGTQDNLLSATNQGPVAVHDYTLAGAFVVTLRVVDGLGATGSARDGLGDVILNSQPSHIGRSVLADLPPTVSFTASATSVSVGQSITLTISANDPDGIVASIQVSWGDGAVESLPGTATSDTHSYSVGGSFTASVVGIDDLGLPSTASQALIIVGGPFPSFTESAATAFTGVSITFDASASFDRDGTIVSYSWSFGDGISGSGVITQHAYSTAGMYTIVLTLTDNFTRSTSTSSLVIIEDRPPIAFFTESSTSALTGVPISFDGTGSSDPDGAIVDYRWDFGDGRTGTGSIIAHSYLDAGNYVVNLIVVDNSGLNNSTIVVITIIDRPPIASFTESPNEALTSVSLTFDGSGSFDPDGAITGYAWNFGDGTTAFGRTTSHSYSRAGTYNVTLTVTDNSNTNAATTASVNILDRPPVASFKESTTTAVTGEPIGFDATASFDPDGTISSFIWFLGDGQTGSGQTVTHVYSAAGTFTITLFVLDNSGSVSGATATVVVHPPPLVASFNSVCAGAATVFTTTVSGGTSPYSYSWNFGDSIAGIGNPASHTYGSSATFTVTLTVTDASGATVIMSSSSKGCGPSIVVTDTSFCTLPNNNSVMIFITDPASPKTFRLVASNPGQLYDNIFYSAAPGSPVSLNIQVPYPYVTAGSFPIQVSSTVTQTPTGCFSPSFDNPSGIALTSPGPLSPTGHPTIVTSNYSPQNFGSTVTVVVTGTVSATGLVYVTIDLDYSIKGTGGWTQGTAQGSSFQAVNSGLGLTLSSGQFYAYTVSGSESLTASVTSSNLLKKDPGFAGVVTSGSTGNPLPGATVKIYDNNGNLLGITTTDQNGVYLFFYKYTGSKVNFTIKAILSSGAVQTATAQMQSNKVVLQNFTF